MIVRCSAGACGVFLAQHVRSPSIPPRPVSAAAYEIEASMRPRGDRGVFRIAGLTGRDGDPTCYGGSPPGHRRGGLNQARLKDR